MYSSDLQILKIDIIISRRVSYPFSEIKLLNSVSLYLHSICPVLGSVVASLPTEQTAPGLISASAVGHFYRGELFHDIYGIGVSLSLSMLCLVLS